MESPPPLSRIAASSIGSPLCPRPRPGIHRLVKPLDLCRDVRVLFSHKLCPLTKCNQVKMASLDERFVPAFLRLRERAKLKQTQPQPQRRQIHRYRDQRSSRDLARSALTVTRIE